MAILPKKPIIIATVLLLAQCCTYASNSILKVSEIDLTKVMTEDLSATTDLMKSVEQLKNKAIANADSQMKKLKGKDKSKLADIQYSLQVRSHAIFAAHTKAFKKIVDSIIEETIKKTRKNNEPYALIVKNTVNYYDVILAGANAIDSTDKVTSSIRKINLEDLKPTKREAQELLKKIKANSKNQ